MFPVRVRGRLPVHRSTTGHCAWIELPGHCDLLALHRARPDRYPALLESVANASPRARYDILFALPGEAITLGRDSNESAFLPRLDRAWSAARVPPTNTAFPFQGGWFVFLGYELAQEVESSLRLPARDSRLPVALALRCRGGIVRDRETGRTYAIAESEWEGHVEQMHDDASACTSYEPTRSNPRPVAVEEDDPRHFLDGVDRIHEYIAAGDVFQVNLSRGWRARYRQAPDAVELYARLRSTNPAPFAGILRWGDRTVLSSSPERLVHVRDRTIETRPIAGTRPRAADPDADRALQRELLAHPKERAEHIMLIDLERNDLGRVCEPGTVVVDELMALESYAHVHHIVSNVRGRLRADTTPGAVIRAVFPGGTITGCPKVRCMEIIREIEHCARGAYTGSMGYLNRDGSLDLNILIRTLVAHDTFLELRAGAGIVADSDRGRELEETRAKARGLLLALGVDP